MKRTSNNDELDRLLDEHLTGASEQLEPSSGFVLSVMESIQAKAAEPPPIAFPWHRVLPALLLVICGMAVLVGLILRADTAGVTASSSHAQPMQSMLHSFAASVQLLTGSEATLCWLIVAACLSAAAIAASFRLTGRNN